MKNRNKVYLVANWKMNPNSIKESEKLAGGIINGIKKLKTRNIEVVLCPPFPYLKLITHNLKLGISLGAQNCYFADSGAYTGEISPRMLKDLGCRFVILGHSERRKYFKENSELINKKIKAVLKHSMTPILAVGEREGESPHIIKEQLTGALEGLSAAKVKQMIIAYEPVWAIGTGNTATTNDAMGGRILIQKILNDLYSKNVANSVPVLYGGSTNSKNIMPFIDEAEMAGALVGTSSLKSKEFLDMVEQISINQ